MVTSAYKITFFEKLQKLCQTVRSEPIIREVYKVYWNVMLNSEIAVITEITGYQVQFFSAFRDEIVKRCFFVHEKMKNETLDLGTKVLMKHMRTNNHMPITTDTLTEFLSKFAEESDDSILMFELKIFKLGVSVLLNRNDERMLRPV